VLTASERETVFTWACLVAFADGTFDVEEHLALQQVARAFGLEGHHARRLFHYAKSVHINGGADHREFGGGRRRYDYTGGSDHRSPQGAVRDRNHALRVLGLDSSATADDIKKRHRELVREFHPDKHQHLGEVAAKEAEDRFREVQAAYEVLTG
jgi:DnaJ like chaperone protein